jgi:hypothetical protein
LRLKSLRFLKKVIPLILVVFSLSFLFQKPSFAQTHHSPVYLSDSSSPQSSLPTSKLDNTDWVITSVPIRPLFPGAEWEVKSDKNGSKLIITHGDQEVLTLVKKELLQ